MNEAREKRNTRKNKDRGGNRAKRSVRGMRIQRVVGRGKERENDPKTQRNSWHREK